MLLLEGQGHSEEEPVTQEAGVLRRAAVVLMCISYRNQALHVFVRPALVVVAMAATTRIIKGM